MNLNQEHEEIRLLRPPAIIDIFFRRIFMGYFVTLNSFTPSPCYFASVVSGSDIVFLVELLKVVSGIC